MFSPDVEHVSPWDLFLRSVGGGTSTRRSSVSLAPGLEDLMAASICSNLDRVMAMPEAEHFRETLGMLNFEEFKIKRVLHVGLKLVLILFLLVENHVGN